MGIYWDNGNKMETAIVYWGDIGIMEKKMETTIVYWGDTGDNGKENGNYLRFLGLANKRKKPTKRTDSGWGATQSIPYFARYMS